MDEFYINLDGRQQRGAPPFIPEPVSAESASLFIWVEEARRVSLSNWPWTDNYSEYFLVQEDDINPMTDIRVVYDAEVKDKEQGSRRAPDG